MLTHTYEMAPSSYFTVVVRARQRKRRPPFPFPLLVLMAAAKRSHPSHTLLFALFPPPYFFRMHGAKLGNQSLLGSVAKPRSAAADPMLGHGWWVGVLIELIAVFCSAFGKVLLRLAAVREQPLYYVIGVLIAAIISPVFDMVAYAFAPTTLLTACGGMVVVFNVVLAPCILAERLTVQRAGSAMLITIGTVGSSLFGSHDQTEQSQEDYMKLFVAPLAICYYVLLTVWYAIAIHFIRRSEATEAKCAWLAALGGSCSGNSFTTKAGVAMLTCYDGARSIGCHTDPMGEPFFWGMGAGTLLWHGGGFALLALALRKLPALYAVTIYEGTLIVSGALSGALVLRELAVQTWVGMVLYSLSMLLIIGGLGIFVRWPFEELCSAEDDCTAACIQRAWHARGVEAAQRVAVEGEPSTAGSPKSTAPRPGDTGDSRTERSRLVAP